MPAGTGVYFTINKQLAYRLYGEKGGQMQKGKGYMPKLTMREWMNVWFNITSYLRSLKSDRVNKMRIVPDKTTIEYDYYKRDQHRKAGII